MSLVGLKKIKWVNKMLNEAKGRNKTIFNILVCSSWD